MTIPDFREPLYEARQSSRVLVLGSYTKTKGDSKIVTSVSDKALENLKRFLIDKGFVQTKFVKDWEDEKEIPDKTLNVHFGQKSYYYIDNWADILLFVFLPNFDNYGVTREWGHMMESAKNKSKQSIILSHSSINLGSLIKGDIEIGRVFSYTFDNEAELCDFAFSGCFHIVYSLMSESNNELNSTKGI